MTSIIRSGIFKFLGSIKMALPMVLILAVLLATGTIVESIYSTPVAKRFVYGTWWFAGFLVLLAVNLFCSAMTRFPWKKYQTGFVLTHMGIICVLAGSLVTQQWGLDGQIALKEGEQGHLVQEDKPTLYYQIGGGETHEIGAGFPFRAPSPDSPLLIKLPGGGRLKVDQFFLNAQKEVVGVSSNQGERGFPAVQLNLASSFIRQNQWLFLGNPDYGHLDLGPASAYFEKENDWEKRLARGAKSIPPNALAILQGKKGDLKYQTRYHGVFSPPQPLRVGQSYSTGWMDMRFQILNQLPEAVPEQTCLPQPLPSQRDPEPAVHYEVLRGQDKKGGWLGYQDQASFLSQGQTFGIAYGPKQIYLPFNIRLIKFRVGFEPGTQKPASYASDVYYEDSEKGLQVPADISMNKPLHHAGYTIYQASYQADPDGTYISVFSVGKDPGIWLKYGGALVLVFGIVLMFWFKNPAWGRRENHEG